MAASSSAPALVRERGDRALEAGMDELVAALARLDRPPQELTDAPAPELTAHDARADDVCVLALRRS